MLLCSICNEEIFDNDEIKCSKCEVFLPFTCAGIRETSLETTSILGKSPGAALNVKEALRQ
jgi:hypothetical protein